MRLDRPALAFADVGHTPTAIHLPIRLLKIQPSKRFRIRRRFLQRNALEWNLVRHVPHKPGMFQVRGGDGYALLRVRDEEALNDVDRFKVVS
jgi:hypothetical protein